jgi:hypothetical protein
VWDPRGFMQGDFIVSVFSVNAPLAVICGPCDCRVQRTKQQHNLNPMWGEEWHLRAPIIGGLRSRASSIKYRKEAVKADLPAMRLTKLICIVSNSMFMIEVVDGRLRRLDQLKLCLHSIANLVFVHVLSLGPWLLWCALTLNHP